MTVQITGHPHRSLLDIEPGAPFRLDLTAWALRRRSHNAIDRWDGSAYRRVLCVDGGPVALSVTQAGAPEAPRLSTLLAAHAERLDALRRRARSAPLTIIYAARGREHNNVVLAELLCDG